VPPQRAYVASKFAFELDGDGVMGFLNSAEGGGLKTDVVDYKQGPLVDVWRQVGRPKFEDITVKVRGGDLIVNYTDEGVTLAGDTRLVYEGVTEY
jgi:hypothetical protein